MQWVSLRVPQLRWAGSLSAPGPLAARRGSARPGWLWPVGSVGPPSGRRQLVDGSRRVHRLFGAGWRWTVAAAGGCARRCVCEPTRDGTAQGSARFEREKKWVWPSTCPCTHVHIYQCALVHFLHFRSPFALFTPSKMKLHNLKTCAHVRSSVTIKGVWCPGFVTYLRSLVQSPQWLHAV